MNRHTRRLDKLEEGLEPDEEVVVILRYVRDWRGDMREVVEEKRIVIGQPITRIVENRGQHAKPQEPAG